MTINIVIYAMVYLGALLMVYNVTGFIGYVRFVKREEAIAGRLTMLYVPVFLLVMFLLGYLAVGIFGKPDLIVSGILFGGSIFVFIMYRLLRRITRSLIEGEKAKSKLLVAEESAKAKSNFLSNVSHEMRTPLNVIMGISGVAMKNEDLSPETRSQFEKTGLAARHLLGLINNVLDLNRIETGELTVKHESFSLSFLLDQVNAIAEIQCVEKGLSYECACEDALRGFYKGDETLIRQVLLALLDNAAKYTDAPGQVTLAVSGARTGSGAEISFAVKDTGVGISEEYMPHLFETFSQENQSSTNRGGAGVSLSVAKKAADLMGGTLTAESVKGEGSVFTLKLTLEGAGFEEASSNKAAEALSSLEGTRILVVDDIEENADIVCDLLELEGVETERADNGLAALETFERSPERYFSAILMDLRMPVMDGFEATRKIRALTRPDARTVPIIALTANTFESDVRASFDAGMNAHLAKPTDADLLYDTLKKLIAGAIENERIAAL
ncbi:MAG: response regulator [Clostridia bacterium]|nr:response regulator [Clostridia bacterium]